jgi:hypothetical protein
MVCACFPLFFDDTASRPSNIDHKRYLKNLTLCLQYPCIYAVRIHMYLHCSLLVWARWDCHAAICRYFKWQPWLRVRCVPCCCFSFLSSIPLLLSPRPTFVSGSSSGGGAAAAAALEKVSQYWRKSPLKRATLERILK